MWNFGFSRRRYQGNHPDDEGSTHLWHVSLLRDCTALYPRRLSPTILNYAIQRHKRTPRPLSVTDPSTHGLHLFSLLTNNNLRYLHRSMKPEIRFVSICLNYVTQTYTATSHHLSLTLPTNILFTHNLCYRQPRNYDQCHPFINLQSENLCIFCFF
jgi:hypothetical protein